MKRVLCVLSSVLILGLATAQEPERAKEGEVTRSAQALEILNKVDAAIKAVHSVSYDAVRNSTGVGIRFAAPAEGSAVLVGWDGHMAEKFFTHFTAQASESDELIELSGGGNGDMFFLIDHTTKKAYEDMDPGVMGSNGRTLPRFGMIEFVSDKPFDAELGAEGLEFLGEETVDGEICYKIHVTYGEGRGESTWYFSKSDMLPRRRVQNFTVPGMGEGMIEVQISRLQINIEPEESMFRMKLPEGYEQIDDFAP